MAHYNPRMVASMTAFGQASDGWVEWQLRSVNHRYLELAFRLPEQLRRLEPLLRERAAGRVHRGKVEAALHLHGVAAPRLNEAALTRLLTALGEIAARAPVNAIADPVALLRWPGLLEDDPDELERIESTALACFGAAVDDLLAQRQREGAGLRQLIANHLTRAEGICAEVRQLTANHADAHFARLRDRLCRLATQLDSSRLEQEAALLAQKADVTEELERLDIHIAAARAALQGEEPCGRRLDFLMQELSREANTLAAKSPLAEAAGLAVDLKVAIEQAREQVQNVE